MLVLRSRATRRLEGNATRLELLGDIGTDPGVGGRRGGEHRDAGGQVGQERADAAVVGPEVVAPVGDAVGLVDHQQPARRREPRQHLVTEAGVVEPLGAHQQHVDLARGDGVLDRLPLLHVGGVDGDGADAGPLGGSDLVAHQGQQGGHDHGRARALGPQEQRRRRSRPRTCPTRCAGPRARGGAPRPALRSPSTGRRAGWRRRARPAPGGGARPRRGRRSRWWSPPLSSSAHRPAARPLHRGQSRCAHQATSAAFASSYDDGPWSRRTSSRNR